MTLEVAAILRRHAFDLGATFSAQAGATTALLGPNGAGKTTLVELIAGNERLDDGAITLADRILDQPASGTWVEPADRRVGVVFQDYLLFDHLTALDNVAFAARSRGAGRRASRSTAQEWLRRLELAHLGDRRPSQLSGGQQQRIALARALASDPSALLLDEPLAALDVSTRSNLRRWLRSHLDEFPGPRVLVTHDPTEAFLLADRIVVIEEGRITQTGTVDDVRSRPATRWIASLAGTNLLRGTSTGGLINLDDHRFELASASPLDGPVLVTIDPSSVALHQERPSGSPRNVWRTTVAAIEALGSTTRVELAEPLPILVDITPASASELAVRPGTEIWASVKATELGVTGAG